MAASIVSPSPAGIGGAGGAARTLVLVTGSSRSGTSAMAGALRELGLHVPGPYLSANPSNPKGFFESRWSVDYHNVLLSGAGVKIHDHRPDAAQLVLAGIGPKRRTRMNRWVERQVSNGPPTVLKDPRLVFTLPQWAYAASEAGIRLGVVTMLRHPAKVVGSRATYYSGYSGRKDLDPAALAAVDLAGWINVTLLAERHTRVLPRVFVRYEALVVDWRTELARVAAALRLSYAGDLTAAQHPLDDFVDSALDRHRPSWEDIPAPGALVALADRLWVLYEQLCDDPDGVDTWLRLDQLRGEYRQLHDELFPAAPAGAR